MATNIGPKIGIEGEKEYRDALKNIIQQTKTLGSEMEEVAASFGKNATAQEKAAARADVLKKQLAAQSQVVAQTAEMVERSAKAYGQSDTRTLQWQQTLNRANADLLRMDDELKNIVSGVDDLDESMDEAGKSTLTFGDLLKANLASDAIAAGIKATANALKGAAGAVIDLGKASVQSFADRQQLIGGVETLFGDAADTVTKNAENAFATAGISANEYMETVTSFSASLIAAVGDNTQLAAEKADMALRDMSDNANKMGTDMASIQNAYQGFAKQNYTMLDNLKLGYGGTKEEMERLLAQAQALSGVEYNIDSFADIVDAIHVIQKDMGILNATLDESKNTITGSANAMRAAWDNLVVGFADPNADLGVLVENLSVSMQDFLKNLLPAVQNFLPQLAHGLTMLVGQLVPFLTQAIQSTLPEIISGIGTLLTAVLGALPQLLNAQFILGVIDQILALLPQFLQVGIELAAQICSGLGEMLPELIPMVVDTIIDLANTLVAPENVDMLVQGGIDITMGLLDGIIEGVPMLLDAAPEIVAQLVGAIILNAPKLLAAATELVAKLALGLVSSIVHINSAVLKLGQSIAEKLRSLDWKKLGRDVVNGILNGLKNAWASLKNWFTGAWNDLVGGVKDVLGIHSPSKLFADEIGRMIPPGIAIGVDDAMPKAIRSVRESVAQMTGAVLPVGGVRSAGANQYTNNLGGVSVNVYGAPGQDVEALARIVMDKIESAVSRKGAVFA